MIIFGIYVDSCIRNSTAYVVLRRAFCSNVSVRKLCYNYMQKRVTCPVGSLDVKHFKSLGFYSTNTDPNNFGTSSHTSILSEVPMDRPSTIEDEEELKTLLKEILTLKDRTVSNWIVENKVKHLCGAYKSLLQQHKEGFLKTLASEYAVNHVLISKMAETLSNLQIQDSCDHRQLLKTEEKLRNLLTPEYSWLFVHIGRLERGVKFLVDLRTDVLTLISSINATDPSLLQLQQLNNTLKEMLSLWFSVGFLKLERITWKSPCEMLQKISEYEAVHPVRSWTDLKRRVGPYRRCFVYTHSSMPDEPLVVLHTALSDEISSSMRGIVSAASRMSVDLSSAGKPPLDDQGENTELVKAAIFYSITSTQKGLQGIELGNYLIKRVVNELQAEFPLVNKFSTLSPIPCFRLWLIDKLKASEKGPSSVLTQDEIQKLKTFINGDNLWADLRHMFNTNSWFNNDVLVNLLEVPLMRLCAYYLYIEKRRGYALDNVANFHLRNGAVMWRLNWQADLTPRGLGNSCGIMINYRYFLDQLEYNSRRYQVECHIAATEQIQQLATGKLTSKM